MSVILQTSGERLFLLDIHTLFVIDIRTDIIEHLVLLELVLLEELLLRLHLVLVDRDDQSLEACRRLDDVLTSLDRGSLLMALDYVS